MEELEKMSLAELRKYGRELGMRNATTYKKKDLIAEIQKIQSEKKGKSQSSKSSKAVKSKDTKEKKEEKTSVEKRTAKSPKKPTTKSAEKTSEKAVSKPKKKVVSKEAPQTIQQTAAPKEESQAVQKTEASKVAAIPKEEFTYVQKNGGPKEEPVAVQQTSESNVVSGNIHKTGIPSKDGRQGNIPVPSPVPASGAGRSTSQGAAVKNMMGRKPVTPELKESRTEGYRGRRNPERKQGMEEDRGSTVSHIPQRPAARSGFSGGYTDNQSVHEERHYGSRDDRYSGNRDDRYSGAREDRYNNRDDRYGNRDDRYNNNREDRTGSRDERFAGRDNNRFGNHEERNDHYTPHVNLRGDAATLAPTELSQIDSGETKQGILEVMPEGYGFVRCDNYLPGDEDVYVSPAMIRKFGLRTGDILRGNTRIRNQNEKFSALLYVDTVNGYPLEESMKRAKFENLTPIFPNEKIHLEVKGAKNNISMRMMDLISPIGKGQRGMIVSQPKTGKTTLLKQVARAVTHNHPDMHLIVLLIDERPEEVTDIKESIQGENVEVIYSTFDELPDNHKRVSEMVIGRAKRLVEHGEDVMVLLDSITRLARAYNLTVQPSGRTLSGGLDPAALHMPKRFFGAARNMREGGSLTILATALVDTGSKMDDVVFEEFKGTGNMEMVLDRKLSEKRLFPAIDLPKSSTRRDDLLLEQEEMEANFLIRKAFMGTKSEEAVENIIAMFRKTKDNSELVQLVKKVKIVP